MEGFEIPGTNKTPQELEVLKRAVVVWINKRSEHLDALLKILEDPSKDARTDAWKSRIDAMRGDLATFCRTDSQLPQPPTFNALAWMSINSNYETTFVDNIAACQLAVETRDYLTNYIETMAQETKALSTKWDAMLATHRNHETGELEVLNQIEALIKDTVNNTNQAHSQIAAAIKEAKEQLDRIPEGGADAMNIPQNNLIQIAGAAVTYWQAAKVGFADKTMRFEMFLREEVGGPLLLFNEFYEDTEKFVEELGWDKAERKVNDAKSTLSGKSSSGGVTAENIKDTEVFLQAANVILQGHVNNAKKVWEDFANAHRHKFFGPVTPSFERAIFNKPMFDDRISQLRADSLLELVKMWRSDGRTIFGVDISGLPAHVAEQFRAAMRDQLEDIDEIVREPFVDRCLDATKTAVKNTIEFMKIKR